MNITRSANRVIAKYLKQVRRAMRDRDPAEAAGVIEELRSHIMTELSKRGASRIDPIDVEAVLSCMDAPEAYRTDAEDDSAPKPVRSPVVARLGLGFLMTAIVLVAVSFVFGAILSEALFNGFLIASGGLVLCSLTFGLLTWRDPLGKAAAAGAIIMLIAAGFFIPAGRRHATPRVFEPVVEMGGGPTQPETTEP